jgi:8-oxo-dGTP pyrophosphatase MutT (NUDIX family)
MMIWKPNVVVAAVIERDGRFLMVEETDDQGRLVINQPAGHLDPQESLVTAVAREVFEETAWQFEPRGIVGIYLFYPRSGEDFAYLRVCFHGACYDHHPEQALDHGIVRATWFSREELVARQGELRSPLVLTCIDAYRAGQHHPLSLLNHYGLP